MRIWVDDLRPAPNGYIWCKSVDDAIHVIEGAKMYYWVREPEEKVEMLDLDHDAGDFAKYGGDYIEILKWMEEVGINDIPIRLHTMNPVGRENMRTIIQKNNWQEV